MADAIRIKLRRFQIRQANHAYLRGYRLRVEVEEAEGIDQNVFVFRQPPPNPYTGHAQLPVFLTVASFPDMSWYPVGGPDPSLPLPFFRLSFVELDVQSQFHYNAVWEVIRQQVCVLADTAERAAQLEVAETVWCGDIYPGTPSESLSEFDSESW